MRILVVGAGVIGQVYAGRLARAGHSVTVLARGPMAESLRRNGIRLAAHGEQPTGCPVEVLEPGAKAGSFDWGLIAVRFDQLDAVLGDVEQVDARQWATLCNIPDGGEDVVARLGADRTVLAFPGVGGHRDDDGVVRFADVRQQHTTVGAAGGAERPIAQALRTAGFTVDVQDGMAAWLTTHAVFIVGVGAAILGAGGDSALLGRDRAATARMVRAVGQGFGALQRHGIAPVPAPLRTIFTRVPRPIAVRYWQRQLRGAVGVETIAPHVRVTRSTELPALAPAVRQLVGASAPDLVSLLDDAAL